MKERALSESVLHLFATEKHPLHASQIPELMFCPWKSVMKFIDANPRESRSSADTGSAMHKAASQWHKNGKEVRDALRVMREAREEYPMADLHEAEQLFRKYIEDPRNQEANVVAVEHHFTGTFEGISVEGTTDQIREAQEWEVWDLKTSRFPGSKIRDEHTYQLCCYAVLATMKFQRPVRPGGVIMVRQYPKEAYFPYEITSAQAHKMMRHVVNRVHEIRAGHIPPVPGDYCGYCIGVPACMEKHDRYEMEGKLSVGSK